MRTLEADLNEDVLDEYGAVQERWTAMEERRALVEVKQRLELTRVPEGRPLNDVSGGDDLYSVVRSRAPKVPSPEEI
ncbi:MAG TPA: hypothetical protein VGD71_13145 [Kribbella sp.]|jgi:ATP-binding cassette subfamily F protein 3